MTYKERFVILSAAVDEFFNMDLPMDDCKFCAYDSDSVTPIDGHEEDCPIRKLSDAYVKATS